jgi:hypothetical protein
LICVCGVDEMGRFVIDWKWLLLASRGRLHRGAVTALA